MPPPTVQVVTLNAFGIGPEHSYIDPPHYLGTALNTSWGILTRWLGILADGVNSHKRRLP
jgi:hypothetical protein